MAENIVSLALEIIADPTKAIQGINEFRAQAKSAAEQVNAANATAASGAEQAAAATQNLAAAQQEVNATQAAMQRTIAESLQMQGASAEEAAQIYTQMGISGQQAGAEIAAAYREASAAAGSMGEAAQVAGESATESMAKALLPLRTFRMLMYSTFGLISFGFYVTEWARVVQAIQGGISAMEGFDSEASKAFAAMVKGADDALVHFQGLTTEEKIATGQMLIAQTEQRINADVAARTAIEGQSFWNVLSQYVDAVTGALGGNSAALATLGAEFSAKAKATSDELEQNNLLQKQLKELQQLEVQLQKEHSKAAKATDKSSQAQQRWDNAIAVAAVKLPPFVSEIERLQRALLVPDAKANNTLFAYAELNAERLQQHLAPLEATLKQLGIATPEMQIPGVPAGLLNAQLDAVTKLTEAERDRLPTERELQLANAELAREYPNLTAAERQEWAQIMLTSGAYRQHIDMAKSVHSANAQLGASFSALAEQMRTAFSEMAGQLTGWGGIGTRVFDQMFNAVERQIGIEQRQVAEHKIAQVSMTTATLDAVKQLAIVKAIEAAAKGFAALGDLNFWSATQYFASAALWGTVGAFQVASMAGAFSSSKSGSKSVAAAASTSTAAATGSSPELAAGAQSAASRANQSNQQTLQVIFQGPVYGDRRSVNELIQKFNEAVKYNRAQLNASHNPTGRAL